MPQREITPLDHDLGYQRSFFHDQPTMRRRSARSANSVMSIELAIR
jgi:hypothetical protein